MSVDRVGFFSQRKLVLFWGVSFPVWWQGSSGKVGFVEVQGEEKREFVKGMME
jgi:hypothetical protein